MEEKLRLLENKITALEKKISDLSNPATISEQFLDALVKKGFLRYDGVKVLTYTNPSGRDFYSIFTKYGTENIALAIEPSANFFKIESINTSTDTITITNHGLSDGQDLYFATTNQTPGGISPQITYYVISATTDTFKVSLTPGGAAVNITSIGSGNNYVRPQ